MDDKFLLKITLSLSIIGILFLLILMNFLPGITLKIKDIKKDYLNQKIQTRGTIIKIKSYKNSNFQVITLNENNSKIDITLNYISNLTYNQSIVVSGTLRQYLNALQIQADKITLR